MKILFDSHNINLETPGFLQAEGHEVWIPKEDISGVHEFGIEEFLALIKEFRPDVLVVNSFKFLINREIIDHVGKAIFARMTAPDCIDTIYAKEKGIEVVPLYGSELGDVKAVPLLCLWAILELIRKKDGREFEGKTLGIIGRGRIGTMLGDMVNMGLDMKIATYDIVEERGMNSLEDVLKCDIVSLHITSSEESRNFMDRAKFEEMKDGSYFLNSSRGWLVDDSALKEALESGKLAGAWSDFPIGFEHKNLLITNHQGGKTKESSQKTEVILVNKLLQWLQK